MKIGIYSPYLDTVGGGEKYILTIAEFLSQKDEVDVFLDDHLNSLSIEEIKQRIKSLHQLDLGKVNFIEAPFGKNSSAYQRAIFLKKYDYLFYLTDGSVFYSTAKKSFIHFQSPIKNTVEIGIKSKIKLSSWQLAIYNSNFTKEIVEQSWPFKGVVLYPPVQVNDFKPLKKKKQIISVGRFFGFLKDKKHSLLIDSFKSLSMELKDWTLCLVGGAGAGDLEYIKSLKKQAQGFNIEFFVNLPFEKLKIIYGETAIYWHAAGFGENDPTRMEHFGITTVEGMSAGCVPIVVNLGGQKEIVQEGENGLLWNDLDELKSKTLLIAKDKALQEKLAKGAIVRSKMFSKEKFCQQVAQLVYGY
jgi:glycosyltransferase involved in cell wall biosynthesis